MASEPATGDRETAGRVRWDKRRARSLAALGLAPIVGCLRETFVSTPTLATTRTTFELRTPLARKPCAIGVHPCTYVRAAANPHDQEQDEPHRGKSSVGSYTPTPTPETPTTPRERREGHVEPCNASLDGAAHRVSATAVVVWRSHTDRRRLTLERSLERNTTRPHPCRGHIDWKPEEPDDRHSPSPPRGNA